MLTAGATERELSKFEKELSTITLASQRCDFVCRVYGAHQHEGQMVLIMKEYVEDLTRMQQRVGAMPVRKALIYADQICRGLVSLHHERITVFDLKPANILIDENDQIAISDFGISKLQGTWSTATAATQSNVGGTPQYQAPEQYDSSPETEGGFGKAATPADIWAFGCVLLSLLTGDNPWPEFSGGSGAQQIMTVRLALSPRAPTSELFATVELEQRVAPHAIAVTCS